MKHNFDLEIISLLMSVKKDGISKGKLLAVLGVQKKQVPKVKLLLEKMRKDNLIILKKDKFFLRNRDSYFEALIVKVSRTHGFIKNILTEEESFVRGRDLKGAIPGDKVLAKTIAKKDEKNRSDNAVVVAFLEQSESVCTGIIVGEGTSLFLCPCGYFSPPLVINNWNGCKIKVGDRVRYTINKRSERHSEHIVDIVYVYGSADLAKIAVDAYFEEKNFPVDFAEETLKEAVAIQAKGINTDDYKGRLDLRHLPIFTIDGADTKDIDDAISIEKTDFGYNLGVHIADVSHYVTPKTVLHKEAFERGTSVYIANRVFPMLPKELSNGICSLNPCEDRLAFSCLMSIMESGEIKSFEFKKTVIRSRVQGVYTEINTILDSKADEKILSKYGEVLHQIPLMKELAEILQKNRAGRGAPEIESTESKIICDENGICIDVKERTRGFSEQIIEEFMLCANNCAAKLAMTESIPFVYRIHEAPTEEKLLNLNQTLVALGIDVNEINEKSKARDLALILEKTRDNERSAIINRIVLRTMMKAKYSTEPIGHYGLVMQEYAHFTSPIRRLADLSIHRILTEYLASNDKEKLVKKLYKYADEAAMRASTRELAAVNAERDCEKYYTAEYMKNHIGEEFDGIISGAYGDGFFVELPNTVEGRVSSASLPAGDYQLKDNIAFIETLSGKTYTIGEKTRVRCVGASVGLGTIDFELA